MAASDPAGGQQFWFNGVTFEGVARSGVDTTGLKFWFNGIPLEPQFPAVTATFGVAWARGSNLPVIGTGNY